ncbi:MAG TPA: aminotransferase class V-fold PLP-dependent enzyme [Myxococcota bacterium]|jgi:kynureninase|nr:aminotransferase class V-fold PLP-dependent enzyme [Myxococcota bacterium]
MLDDLAARWRGEFPILERKLHLASHTLGAMPRGARARAAEFLDRWDEDGVAAWETWLPFAAEMGELMAEIVGAAPGTVVLLPNVSTAQSVVASCLDFSGPRRRVVMSDLEFHSVGYIWQEQARRRGAELAVVPSADGVHPPTAALAAAVDERTAIVPLSHVTFRSGALEDVAALAARARDAGAMVLLDCYQSAGTVPFSLAALGVDFACGGSVKWLCGGPGAAWLYVRPDRIGALEPVFTGWFAHERPFAFEPGPIVYAGSIRRFAGGTAPVPAFYTARAGWEIVRSVGVARIREKSLRLTGRLIAGADARGLRLNTPRDEARRGGTVSIDFEGAESACAGLLARGVLCDWRPRAGLRVSPHFYTTDAEVDRFFEELAAVAPCR